MIVKTCTGDGHGSGIHGRAVLGGVLSGMRGVVITRTVGLRGCCCTRGFTNASENQINVSQVTHQQKAGRHRYLKMEWMSDLPVTTTSTR